MERRESACAWRLLAVVISPGMSGNGEDVDYSLD